MTKEKILNSVFSFIKKIKILYKLAILIRKSGNDLLYLINIPVILNLNFKNKSSIPNKKNIIKVKDWIKRKKNINYKKIRPSSTIIIDTRESINHIKPKKFNTRQIFYPETFMLKIPAKIIDDGIVITEDNKILSDFFNQMGKELIHHRAFTKWFLPPIKKISGKTVMIIDKYSNCYFHWIFDVLPRLIMLKDINIANYLFYQLKQPFQLETLNILGIDSNKIIQIKKYSNFKINNLIVPSLPGSPGNMPPNSCKILREKMLNKNLIKDKKYQKIYISRNKTKSRKILNEKDIVGKLKNIGFKYIELENYTFTDQVKIFNSAKIVISAHGSGLTNIVFCDPKTKIIEIFPENYINACYRDLSYHCKLDYYYYIEKSIRFSDNNMIINEKKFFNLLHKNSII